MNQLEQILNRASVTKRQAEAFVRVVIYGETQTAVALDMGISRPAVRQHVEKVKAKLSKPWIKKIADETLEY